MTNGGTLKLLHEDGVFTTGTVQTGRLFDAGADSSGQLCNIPPSVPQIISPLDTDVPVKQTAGDVFILFLWTPSTDPEGSTVTYETEISLNALFNPVEASVTGITSTDVVQVVTISNLPAFRFWHVRARDKEGRESAWSPTSSIRLVLDDGKNHGAGDCNISAGLAPGLLMPALFGAALMAFGFARRRR